MKKEYNKPLAEIIEFAPEDEILNGDLGNLPGVGGEVGGGSVSEDDEFDW